MDVTEFLRQLQPHLTLIAIAAMGMIVVLLRNMGKRIDLNTEKAQIAVEKSELEVEEAQLKVDREKLQLKVMDDMFNRVRRLEDDKEGYDKRLENLIERDQEHEDVLTVLRNQRDAQDKELSRLNELIDGLKKEVVKLQNENVKLKEEVKHAQEAQERAERARDLAEEAHVIERNRLNGEIAALNEKLEQMQSRLGTAETLITQVQDKGISPQ